MVQYPLDIEYRVSWVVYKCTVAGDGQVSVLWGAVSHSALHFFDLAMRMLSHMQVCYHAHTSTDMAAHQYWYDSTVTVTGSCVRIRCTLVVSGGEDKC